MFESLGIARTLRMEYGWLIEWLDGRVTKINVTVIEVAAYGEKAVLKTIRWAA